ncbi:MAG TPA: hypothetical protein VFI15_05680 [Candidatus Limnocylindrales bacterium]|nr:hypothetical protein [Candidatus Limnocylindrales bacterium]
MRGPGGQGLAVVMVLAVAACGGPAASSTPGPGGEATATAPASSALTSLPSPEPTAAPTPTSTVQPTAEPAPTEPSTFQPVGLGFANTFVMRVAVNGLNVRAKPSKNGVSMGKAAKGELFRVYDWPVNADGYTWYYGYEQLQNDNRVPKLPTPYNEGYDGILVGWMAAGSLDAPFLMPVGARCPATIDLLNLEAMLGSEKIDCFGSDTLVLQGTFGCGGCGGEDPGHYEPFWLAAGLEFDILRSSNQQDGAQALHFPPDGQAPPAEGTIIKVRGHFDDSRSETCRITVLGDDGNVDVKIPNKAADQYCRARFVVESYEVLGTDPTY